MGHLDGTALTVPQFRTLHFVSAHAGANLSATAEFLGLTLPSTSKLVDQLVRQGILMRGDDATDRRRMILRLTPKGDALLKYARSAVEDHLARTLSGFDGNELAVLNKVLTLLQESFPVTPPCSGPAKMGLSQNNEHPGSMTESSRHEAAMTHPNEAPQ